MKGRNAGSIFDSSQHAAETLVAESRARLEMIAVVTRTITNPPRVFCMESLDPVYCCGHWVPEMVRIADGIDALGHEGSDSVRIPWVDVARWAPEVLIIMPGGLDMEKAAHQSQQLFNYPCWSDVPAVQQDRVYVVDANAYFARPGLRVIEGTELLAHLLHPTLFAGMVRTTRFVSWIAQ